MRDRERDREGEERGERCRERRGMDIGNANVAHEPDGPDGPKRLRTRTEALRSGGQQPQCLA